MGSKAFDIILFGATGFTGQFVAKYIHKQNTSIKWAIAGRSQGKLSALMTELVNFTHRNLPDVLIADANDPKSLADICGEAKIVLNCTGPFRFLGKEVVEACLQAKCTYMDICGEPQFMEKCFLDYHDKAVENNVLILHACAFDSVPADLGALFTMRQYDSMKCCSIESFLTVECPMGLKGHFTTYESAVHGMGDLSALKKIRKEIQIKHKPPVIILSGPKVPRLTSYKFENRVNKYVIPFMGSDASVVRSSQRALSMRNGQLQWPQYTAFITLSDIYTVAATSFYGSVFSALSTNPWGRSLLLSYPETYSGGVFSKKGPTQEQLDNTSFQMHFYGRGYSSVLENTVKAEKGEKGGKGRMSEVERAVGKLLDGEEEEESEKKKVARGEAALLKSEVANTQSISNKCSINLWKKNTIKDKEDDEPNKFIHVIVKGPEPGYVATPAIFFALALCVLEEREILPLGGVLTPSAAFYDSPTVFNRLIRAGLEFEVVSDSSVEGNEGKESMSSGLSGNVSSNKEQFSCRL